MSAIQPKEDEALSPDINDDFDDDNVNESPSNNNDDKKYLNVNQSDKISGGLSPRMTNSDESKKMEGLTIGGGIKSFGTPGKMSKM